MGPFELPDPLRQAVSAALSVVVSASGADPPLRSALLAGALALLDPVPVPEVVAARELIRSAAPSGGKATGGVGGDAVIAGVRALLERVLSAPPAAHVRTVS